MKRGLRGRTNQEDKFNKLYFVEADTHRIILSKSPVIENQLTGFSLVIDEPTQITHNVPRQAINPEDMVKHKKTNYKNKSFVSKYRNHKHQAGKTLRSLMLDPLDLYTLNICKVIK